MLRFCGDAHNDPIRSFSLWVEPDLSLGCESGQVSNQDGIEPEETRSEVTHGSSTRASVSMPNSRRFTTLRNILCGGRGPFTNLRARKRQIAPGARQLVRQQ